MINFDQIVLNPTVGIFAIACKFTLTASKPEAAPVVCRGVFTSAPLDVLMQDDTIFSDQETSLGIRTLDFAVVPDRGDMVEIIEPSHRNFGSKYWIGDSDEDGQGGIKLLLRTQEPPE